MVIKPTVVSEKLCVDYEEFSRSWSKPFGKKNKITGVYNLTFTVNEGDVIGIIGRNGAGKSTLLKSVAGLIRPSRGKITINGRVILLAGANPGFSLDATGRNNITELARAYGVPNHEIPDFTDSIINFASLGGAIDRNVRGYSTGMRGKLGFGFMTGLKPDILLIDETLAVGDAEFRKKATERLRNLVQNSGSVLISTHSLGLAREICNRGLLLDRGNIISDSDIESTLQEYRSLIGQ